MLKKSRFYQAEPYIVWLLYSSFIWLHVLLIKISGDIEFNPEHNKSKIEVFQFVTGILKVFLHTASKS